MARTGRKPIFNMPKAGLTLPSPEELQRRALKRQAAKKPVRKTAAAKKSATRAAPERKKPGSKLAHNSLLPDLSTLTPEQVGVIQRHEQQLAWQKKELARQKRAADKRAREIATKGYLYKGRWIPLQHRPSFIIKIEPGGEGTAERPIKIEQDEVDGQVTLSHLLAKTRHGHEGERDPRRRGGCGPDITKSFDRQYPLIAERFERQMLDEADDAGSLCDFVTADEGSDGDDPHVDG